MSTQPLSFSTSERVSIGSAGNLSLAEQLDSFEAQIINQCLVKHCGNQCHVAEELGIHRNTLGRKIDKMLEQNSLWASLRRGDYKKVPRGTNQQ